MKPIPASAIDKTTRAPATGLPETTSRAAIISIAPTTIEPATPRSESREGTAILIVPTSRTAAESTMTNVLWNLPIGRCRRSCIMSSAPRPSGCRTGGIRRHSHNGGSVGRHGAQISWMPRGLRSRSQYSNPLSGAQSMVSNTTGSIRGVSVDPTELSPSGSPGIRPHTKLCTSIEDRKAQQEPRPWQPEPASWNATTGSVPDRVFPCSRCRSQKRLHCLRLRYHWGPADGGPGDAILPPSPPRNWVFHPTRILHGRPRGLERHLWVGSSALCLGLEGSLASNG